jgi:DNA-binding transcriptional MerR regulator
MRHRPHAPGVAGDAQRHRRDQPSPDSGDDVDAAGGTTRDPLPAKVYFRIGEVAELVGVEPHVLRYWEREFRTVRPTKSARGQRVYSRRDVENLMRVRELLYKEGFTIAGARKKLQRSPAPVPNPVEAGKTRKELLAMREEIEAFLAELDPSSSTNRESTTVAAARDGRSPMMQGYARAKK